MRHAPTRRTYEARQVVVLPNPGDTFRVELPTIHAREAVILISAAGDALSLVASDIAPGLALARGAVAVIAGATVKVQLLDGLMDALRLDITCGALGGATAAVHVIARS